MKGISLNTLAHPRFYCARLQPSRRRVLAAPGIGTAANQRTFPDPLGFARPFLPSSPRPGTPLRAARIGGLILPQAGGPANKRHARARNGQRTNVSCQFPESGQTDGFRYQIGTPFSHSTPHQRSPRIRRWAGPWRSHPAEIRFAETDSTSPAYGTETPVLPLAFNRSGISRHTANPSAADQARISDVRQDSDFRTEIASRKNRVFPPSLRASGARRETSQPHTGFTCVSQNT
jgi:hypothetical protein